VRDDAIDVLAFAFLHVSRLRTASGTASLLHRGTDSLDVIAFCRIPAAPAGHTLQVVQSENCLQEYLRKGSMYETE
jgi:hypothetical protein